MIVTESKNRKIKICDQILEEIYSQIQKNDYDPEKGGIIVGRENLNNENIILEYISKPLKNDICTRTRYTRKDEGHLKYFIMKIMVCMHIGGNGIHIRKIYHIIQL